MATPPKKRGARRPTLSTAIRRVERALARWPLEGGLDGYHAEVQVILDELAAYQEQAKEIHEIRLRLDRLMPMVRWLERSSQQRTK